MYFNATQDTDANANKLIEFIRGIDSYDEDADGKTNERKRNDFYKLEFLKEINPQDFKNKFEKKYHFY